MEPRDHSKWGSSCEQCLAPFFHSWGFGCMSFGLFSMVTLAACDLLTVLQTFPHSGRFDILFILLSSPESLSVWAKPAFVYNFSGNFHRGGKKIPSLLFQCFIFKSTLSPSLFVLNQILLQGIALYSNGNCCISINRRRSCEWVQKNLDITFYWTFTFSSLFFENNIPCLVLSFFPTFVLRLTIMWNIEFGKHWMESF